MEFISLGCGGGRHQILDQSFKTGGFRVHTDDVNIHVDPGPGALLLTKQLGLSPTDLDAVFVSHSHLDHSTDAEVLAEATNRNGSGKGRFLGSESAVHGFEDLAPAVSEHHRREMAEVVSLSPEDEFSLGEVGMKATPTVHTDPTGVGAKIDTGDGTIGYTSDTELFDGLIDNFRGTRVLIANVTRPGDRRIDNHLCTEDLIEILADVEPEVAIILHMGMLFLQEPPTDEAEYVERETGVRTVPGTLGTKLDVNDDGISIGRRSIQTGLGRRY